MTNSKCSALIVAVGEYDDKGLQQLTAPPSDAEALTGVLEDPDIGGFDVHTLLNRPSHEVDLAVEEFFADRHPDNLLLLHFSCHGVKDDDGELYFAMTDTKMRRLLSTAVSAQHVNRCMSRSRSRRIVLLLDCCYAGAFERGMAPRAGGKVDIKDRFGGRGRAVITASSAIQSAFEGGQLADVGDPAPSIFTSALVEGLETGDADLGQDGVVALDELYEYVYEKVRATTPSQTPEKWLFGVQGELIIARRARPVTTPTPLAADLQVLMDSPFASARAAAVQELQRLLRSGHGGLALAARIALEQLSEDDSRSVSAAATAALRECQPEATASPAGERIESGRDRPGGIGSGTALDTELAPVPRGRSRQTPRQQPKATSSRPQTSATGIPQPADLPPVKPTRGRAVGFDLGTTNSAVAVMERGEPTVIANAEGSRTTPSVVAFAKNGQVLVGTVAMRQAVTNVDRTIRSVKREMGTDWTIDIDDKKFTAQQISAFILQKLKRDAESYLGETITDAVITTPAYFNDAQRQATKEAGQIAGLNVLRIINEPTSAALAYHLEHEDEATILVFDLGGGSLSVSLIEVGEGVVEVKATSGDNHLGGDDWDQRIMDWLVQDFNSGYGIDLSEDKTALRRLCESAEKAKIELSDSTETHINLPCITYSEQGPLHLDGKLTRAEFQRMTSDLLDRCKAPFKQVIKDASVKLGDIRHVVLVGGSTRMPAVVDLVKELTGKEPDIGAGPESAVAMGGALQAGVLKGEVKDVLLLDVTPLSLGIATKGGIFTKFIERNTTIPVRRSEILTTAEDNQPSVRIQVFQGEREIAEHNKNLGVFELAGIAPAPRGLPQIEVLFAIDANGILDVSAKDLGTGKEQSVTISGGSALAKEDIQRMVDEAEKYAEEDARRREEAEVRNHADTLAYSTEKSVRENQDKISAAVKAELESAIADLKKALQGTDIDAIKEATEKTAQVSQKMATAHYGT